MPPALPALAPAVEITGALYRSSYDGAGNRGTRTLYVVGTTYTLSQRSRLYTEYDVNRYAGALVPASGQAPMALALHACTRAQGRNQGRNQSKKRPRSSGASAADPVVSSFSATPVSCRRRASPSR